MSAAPRSHPGRIPGERSLSWGGPGQVLTQEDLEAAVAHALAAAGPARRVLAVPPDFSRFHSRAGQLTAIAYRQLGERMTDVLPALGTHRAMTGAEISRMFPGVPEDRFRIHNWREDLVSLGEVPGAFISEVSEGLLDYSWPAQLNRLVAEGGHDLVLSIGQVLPHEVIGMANHAKNLFVGTGGREAINRSHYLGAVWGMERIMGRADNPVRAVINRAASEFLSGIPVLWILTVLGPATPEEAGGLAPADSGMVLRGVFVGDGLDCFYRAAELARECNVTVEDEPADHVVAWLDPDEFHSTWLGNKAIYRSRMLIADGGMLDVIAPGVSGFGEDPGIDRLIRRYGYRGTEATLAAVDREAELAGDLSAAAHLIHGSSEGRFTIRYAAGGLTREEVEAVGFSWRDPDVAAAELRHADLSEGWNRGPDGESLYYLSRPAQGLWAARGRLLGQGQNA